MRILDGSDRLQMSLDNVSPNSLVKGQLQHSDLFCSQHQVTKQRVEVETYMDVILTLSDYTIIILTLRCYTTKGDNM